MMSEEWCKYKEERAHLRESISAKQERIDNALIDCMNRFNSDESGNIIDVRDFKGLPLGERHYINEGIYVIPIEIGADEWIFYTSVDEGYYFGLHGHPVGEICWVIKGVMIDKADDNREYQAGDCGDWTENVMHKPGAKVGGGRLELYVVFDVRNLDKKINLTPVGR